MRIQVIATHITAEMKEDANESSEGKKKTKIKLFIKALSVHFTTTHQVREPSRCHVHGHQSKHAVGRGDKLCTDLVMMMMMMMMTLIMVLIALPHHAKTQQARSGRGEA